MNLSELNLYKVLLILITASILNDFSSLFEVIESIDEVQLISRLGVNYVVSKNDDKGFSQWIPIKDGPGSKINAARLRGPMLRISFCATGYKGAFEQYKEFITEKYPEVTVISENYPVSKIRTTTCQIFTALKYLLMAAMLFSQWDLFRRLRLPEGLVLWLAENRNYAVFLIFFLGNLIESQLSSTGAFEVFIDDVPVWSKIQSGRLPNPPEIVQMIENHLKLGVLDSPTLLNRLPKKL